MSFAKSGAPVPVVPGDYGLLQYRLFSIFFQYTAPAPLAAMPRVELLALLALFSSGVLHLGVLGIVRALLTPPPLSKPLELTNPDEYAARFGLHRAPIETPPPPAAGEGVDKPGGAGVKDPGAQDKKPPGGGQKNRRSRGKVRHARREGPHGASR